MPEVSSSSVLSTPSTQTHTCPSTHPYHPAHPDQTGVAQTQQFRAAVQAIVPLGSKLLHGMEVSQAIQNMSQAVPLVADKPTLVRAYLKLQLPFDVKISGLLSVSWRPNPHSPYTITRLIGSTDYVKVAANATPSLREQREDLQKSLNFVLPDEVRRAGYCRIQLLGLEVNLPVFGASVKVPVLMPPSPLSVKQVQFQATPPLRLRMLGIRYQDADGNSYEPAATDYTLIQSWLLRAFPISQLEWTQAVVAAPPDWSFDASEINALLRGIRMQDVADGMDARTHYYGLVSDGGGFMRGLASGIPDTPDPSTVASGPTGANWGWDTDGSYGDWYTGHELGHTLGRYHAEFCGAAWGAPYPFTDGQLSDADGEFVGLDFGDATNAIPRRALPGVVWHDVMSYCDYQWLSSFTYMGIHDRLLAEDSLAGMVAQALPMESTKMSDNSSIHVLATVNLTRNTGTLRHVIASSKLLPNMPITKADAVPDLRVRVYSGETQVGDYPARFYPDACQDESADNTGIVDVVIPADSNGSVLELVLNGQVIDTFTRSATAKTVRDIRPVTDASLESSLMESTGLGTAIEWTDDTITPSLQESTVLPGVSYIVQISADQGETWQTVGYDLNQTKLTLDPRLVAGVSQLQVRVTATDGFTAQTVTQTLALMS